MDSRAPGERLDFTYSGRDRLVQVTRGPPGLEEIQGQFDYNFAGDRVRHRFSDRGDVDYFYDDGSVIIERNAADDSLLAYYQYADRLIALAQPLGKQYYHHDALGSTIGLTDAAGNDTKSYRLDPWGNIRSQSGSSDNRHIFTGKEHDVNTGLVYFGARYYDPEVGRFISQDPYLGKENTPPSLHRYQYAYSNPTVYIDLEGYFPTTATSFAAASGQYQWDQPNQAQAPDDSYSIESVPLVPGSSEVHLNGEPMDGVAVEETLTLKELQQREGARARKARKAALSAWKNVNPADAARASRRLHRKQRINETVPEHQRRIKWESLGEQGCKDRICGDLHAMDRRKAAVQGPDSLNPFDWAANVWEIGTAAVSADEGVTPDLQAATVTEAAKYTHNIAMAATISFGAFTGVHRMFRSSQRLRNIEGAAAASRAEGDVILTHGTSSNRASKIARGGFRGETFLAEDVATSRHFAYESIAKYKPGEMLPRSLTSIEFRIPRPLAKKLGLIERSTIGQTRGLKWVDIQGGSGFERVLSADKLKAFNESLKAGEIGVRRLKL